MPCILINSFPFNSIRLLCTTNNHNNNNSYGWRDSLLSFPYVPERSVPAPVKDWLTTNHPPTLSPMSGGWGRVIAQYLLWKQSEASDDQIRWWVTLSSICPPSHFIKTIEFPFHPLHLNHLNVHFDGERLRALTSAAVHLRTHQQFDGQCDDWCAWLWPILV